MIVNDDVSNDDGYNEDDGYDYADDDDFGGLTDVVELNLNNNFRSKG